MELTNQTPIPAKLLTCAPDAETRAGMLVAKATFVLNGGVPELDQVNPAPIFDDDVETELGLLPRDTFPRTDDAFEVILLGKAHPRQPASEAQIALSVGAVRREIAVFGEREWKDGLVGRSITAPALFAEMPLTWDRAFGGQTTVLVDKESFVPVSYPLNTAGKGFDAEPAARALAENLRAPDGYPTFDRRRPLPNLEDPANRITRWEDAPLPVCWATLPMESGLHALRVFDLPPAEANIDDLEIAPSERAFHRAHPQWILPVPAEGTEVTLENLHPSRAKLSFALPRLRALVDYALGPRSGVEELAPQMLVLLPEQDRFYLVYRFVFHTDYEEGAERALRLRLTDGWYRRVEGGS